jgi:hypothetical protein
MDKFQKPMDRVAVLLERVEKKLGVTHEEGGNR